MAKIQLTNLKASNFAFDYDLDHPNKMPFSGILTYFDVPSDQAPHGSGGRKVLIGSDVGVPALEGLIGMGVNYLEGSMSDHDPTNKIGVITSAEVGEPTEFGTPVYIEGHIFANDFPDAALDIKLNQSALGFSYETTNTLLMEGLYEGEPVAVVTQVVFTGCSVLFAADAAYHSTTLAASAENNEKEGDPQMDEKLEQILIAVQGLKEYVDTKFENFKKEDEIEDAIAEAIDDAHNATEDSSELAASSEEVTEETVEETTIEEENTEEEESTEEVAEETGAEASLQAAAELKAELEAVRKELAELKAGADIQAAARKSILFPKTLMQKYELPEEDEETKLLASIEEREDLSVEERMALKFEMRDKKRRQSK